MRGSFVFKEWMRSKEIVREERKVRKFDKIRAVQIYLGVLKNRSPG